MMRALKNIIIPAFFGVFSLSVIASPPGDSLAYYDENVDYDDSVYIQRLNALNTQIPMTYNEHVKGAIDFFADNKRGFVRKVMKRQDLFFDKFEKYLEANEMPKELKYLSVIESGLNPQIKSRAGAMGLWQFMPATGRMMHLDQDYYIDERMDPDQATQAACDYLKSLHKSFKDWHLALAAYNCGPGNVRKAIRRSGYKESFWEIYDFLPSETRFYVPKFISINYLMNYPEEHNIRVERPYHAMRSDTLVINQYFNLEEFSKQIDVCSHDMVKLNPCIQRNVVTADHKNFVLYVPSDKMPFIVENREALLDSAKKKGAEELNHTAGVPQSYQSENKFKYVYKVRSGDVLGVIASRHSVTVSQLRYWNNISGNTIYAGQSLNIYKDPKYFKTAEPKPQPTIVNAAPVKRVGKQHTVETGDTLWAISKKYGLSVDHIKRSNNLSGDNLKVGQVLVF